MSDRKIEVFIAERSDQSRWEVYLAQHHSLHHAFSWHWREILEKTFGHKPLYLLAVENQVVVGLLPLFLLKSFLFGKALISLPYLNGGGILANDADVSSTLIDYVMLLQKRYSAKYVELRLRSSWEHATEPLIERTHKAALLLPLSLDSEDFFASFPAKLRSQIRRPTKSGIQARVSPQGLSVDESLKAFYQVFSRHMRDLGTPVYPRSLFHETLRHFGNTCRIITLWHHENPVGAGITISHAGVTEIPWASTLLEYNKYSANMLLYWEAMKAAVLDGSTVFDFGRSTIDSGSYQFKLQWGATPLPLHWYYLGSSEDIPDVNPKGEKFSRLVSCWKHLPVSIANCLGPYITRNIP